MVKIEGRNPVIELLRGPRRVKAVFVQKGLKGEVVDRIVQACGKQSIRLVKVDRDWLDKNAGTDAHQGVIAEAEDLRNYSLKDIVKLAESRNESPFVVILDQIQDPHNFGAIIRTAYVAGVHGIVYPKDRATGVTPVVAKASAGAVEHMMLAEVININNALRDLKDAGLWIAGAEIDEAQNLYETDLKGPVGVVIGNEGSGLRRLVKENCDFLVKIPIKGNLNSLNASVAAGIIIYEIVRQRSLAI